MDRLSATSLVDALTLHGWPSLMASAAHGGEIDSTLVAICFGVLVVRVDSSRGDGTHGLSVAILGSHDALRAAEAIRAGASGVVTRHQGVTEIVEALETVAAGGLYLAPALADAALQALVDGHRPLHLTERQRELLSYLASGTSTASIATLLGVSTHSARNAIRDLFRRLDVHSRAEAVALAHQRRLISGSEPLR